ncbi:hypothetical protein FO440_04300 [Mucilaginibacter corticis]|uniref:Carboxypeptidase-like regulatory domain-containing protein n=1 Tax=Mucilaginibacter corticis TaxID=2597670 RepID=A0A556MTZ5_9SPHI|nr:hypothetical protein [Mucilaginibacter corticis]TSJ43420.1 hypothetical protein FO440_04300 [Mucilaginibacter corticis]
MRLTALAILFLFTTGLTHAQSILKGRVMELHNDVLLSGIKVENQTQNISTYSDPHGNFLIKAKKGDLLCFSGLNYMTDTVYLTSLKYQVILLQLKLNQLNEVQISTGDANVGSFGHIVTTGPLGSHTVQYQEGGGVTIKIFDSHSDAKKREKIERLERDGEKDRKIREVFNAQNLKNYVPITGQELSNFIFKYTPDIKTYYDKKFNLSLYINESYQDFLKIPEEKRRSTTFSQLNNAE